MRILNLDLANLNEEDVMWIIHAVKIRQEKAHLTPGTCD
jgi:hypothetical protein